MSNMTYFAERRRLEMDAVLKKAGHTVRPGEFETCPTWGHRSGHASMDSADQHERITFLGVRSQSKLARKSSKRVQTGERGSPDRKSTRLNSSHANISYAV